MVLKSFSQTGTQSRNSPPSLPAAFLSPPAPPQALLRLSRNTFMREAVLQHRRLIAEVLNTALIALALAISFLLRFDFSLEQPYIGLLTTALPLLVIVKLSLFHLFELQHLAWRYI